MVLLSSSQNIINLQNSASLVTQMISNIYSISELIVSISIFSDSLEMSLRFLDLFELDKNYDKLLEIIENNTRIPWHILPNIFSIKPREHVYYCNKYGVLCERDLPASSSIKEKIKIDGLPAMSETQEKEISKLPLRDTSAKTCFWRKKQVPGLITGSRFFNDVASAFYKFCSKPSEKTVDFSRFNDNNCPKEIICGVKYADFLDSFLNQVKERQEEEEEVNLSLEELRNFVESTTKLWDMCPFFLKANYVYVKIKEHTKKIMERFSKDVIMKLCDLRSHLITRCDHGIKNLSFSINEVDAIIYEIKNLFQKYEKIYSYRENFLSNFSQKRLKDLVHQLEEYKVQFYNSDAINAEEIKKIQIKRKEAIGHTYVNLDQPVVNERNAEILQIPGIISSIQNLNQPAVNERNTEILQIPGIIPSIQNLNQPAVNERQEVLQIPETTIKKEIRMSEIIEEEKEMEEKKLNKEEKKNTESLVQLTMDRIYKWDITVLNKLEELSNQQMEELLSNILAMNHDKLYKNKTTSVLIKDKKTKDEEISNYKLFCVDAILAKMDTKTPNEEKSTKSEKLMQTKKTTPYHTKTKSSWK